MRLREEDRQRQRQDCGWRILLGRRTVVQLRDGSPGSLGGLRILWDTSKRGGDGEDPLPGVRILWRERQSRELHSAEGSERDESCGEDLRTGDLRWRRTRVHAHGATARS